MYQMLSCFSLSSLSIIFGISSLAMKRLTVTVATPFAIGVVWPQLTRFKSTYVIPISAHFAAPDLNPANAISP
jgi:hypothetical protein